MGPFRPVLHLLTAAWAMAGVRRYGGGGGVKSRGTAEVRWGARWFKVSRLEAGRGERKTWRRQLRVRG